MSLHAQLSPEAQERLQAQRRNSTISSLIIALLMMALIGVILLIISLAIPSKEIPTIITYSAALDEQEELETQKLATSTERKPSAPSSSMAKVIASQSATPTAIPVPDIEVPEPSTDFGDGDSYGSGWGSGGSGGGGGFGNIPSSLKKRCSKADRLQRLSSNGGTPECEDAVVSALQWLKKKQNKDGSWAHGGDKVGYTSLALLAYMGHCETASSEEFGDTVLNGLTYLINVGLKKKGRMTLDLKDKHWCYGHSVAVYALSEAYTLCVKGFGENIPDLDKVVQMSGQFLIDNQHQSGGWDYSYATTGSRGGDVSIVGWHIQALKAMNHTDLPFKKLKRAQRDSLEYIKAHQVSSGAIAYRKGTIRDDGTTLAAVGALCYQIWGKSSHAVTRKACRLMNNTMKFDWNGPDSDLYGHYYAAQVMINYGGDYWESYNKKFRDQVLKNQNKDGSFKDVAGGGKINAVAARFKGTSHDSQIYRTCLATLMLEVYYRFLPATGARSSG